MKRWICRLGLALAWLVASGCALWAVGALYFDFSGSHHVAAWVFAAALVAAMFFLNGIWRRIGCLMLSFVLVFAGWCLLQPSNDRQWQNDVAQTAWSETKGDVVVLHNVRNCEYRTETDYDTHWETRSVDLSKITGIDIAINYWGSDLMAHPILSFQFSDAPPICFSIETRKEVGESYSAIGGFYRQYELIYLVAEEQDVLGVRTNQRVGEDVYLYRTTATPEEARARFVEYLAALNDLHARPRWYNAVTANCTSSIRNQRSNAQRASWDWRMLVNGKGDELMYERGMLAGGGKTFDALKKGALINAAAKSALRPQEYSVVIRAGRGGF